MQYITNNISSHQMMRFYNALDKALENCGEEVMDPDKIKVEVLGGNGFETPDFDGEFTEAYSQDILGFKMTLFFIEHKGLIKIFKDETGTEIFTIVLIKMEICEN